VTEQTRPLFQPGRIVKWLFRSVVVLLALIVLHIGHELWRNNRSVDAPHPRLISDGLEKGINWLVNNRETVLDQPNSMLWWFVKESADITRDERLYALFSDYKRRYLDSSPENVWWHLFDTQSRAPVVMWKLEHLPDYNLHFIYGASCDSVLGKQEVIQRQHDAAFCATYHPFSPACVTHQLMGIRLAQRRHCLDPGAAQQLVLSLQEKIVKQLTWDPRVVDVYIQRVLMLAESGMPQKIKPVWLQRVLNAQLADGGWPNLYMLFPVSRTHYLGLTNKLVIREPRSNFHATAQGVFLFSLLAGGPDQGVSQNDEARSPHGR
jgi:hypothetical protein